MAAPKYLKWNNPGETRTLTGEVGSAYNLFKSVLPELGWTIAFDDPAAFKIVFRNNPISGSGCYVRILDDGLHNLYASMVFEINAYEEMTDIDTGVAPCVVGNGWIYKKSPTQDNVGREWRVIGDDRTFIYTVRHISPTPINMSTYAVGDYHNSIPGMPGFMLTWGFNTGAAAPTSATSARLGAGWLSSGAYTNRVSRNPQTLSRSITGFDVTHSLIGPYTFDYVGVHTLTHKSYDTRRYSFLQPMGNTTVGLLGFMRGVYNPLSDASNLAHGLEFEVTDGVSLKRFVKLSGNIVINTGNNPSFAHVFISLDDWDVI